MSTVVIAGPAVSINGKMNHQGVDITDLYDDEMYLSKKEYGNHLPELWAYCKNIHENNDVESVSEFAKHALEHNYTVVSYTADGELARAGVPVVEAEGSIYRGKCLRCQHEMEITPADYENLGEGEVFSCAKCGKDRVRPEIRLAGERELNRREITNLIRSAPRTIFVDVDIDDLFISKMERESTLSQIVSPTKVSGVNTILMTVDEWIEAGCPQG